MAGERERESEKIHLESLISEDSKRREREGNPDSRKILGAPSLLQTEAILSNFGCSLRRVADGGEGR